MHGTDRAPRLGFGCVGLGGVSGGRSWRSDVRLVQEAVERGVTLFDTADAYGNGVSERILGRALKSRRSQVEIATKGGYRFADRSLLGQSVRRAAVPVLGVARGRSRVGAPRPIGAGGNSYEQQDFSPNYLRSAVEASLRRLDTDYIDVFQLHGPPEVLPEAVAHMDALVRSGKIRRFGIGAESVSSARDWLAVDRIDVLQVPFGMMDPQAADVVFSAASDRGVDIWARGVFGGGILALVGREGVGRNGSTVSEHPKWPLIAELSAVADEAGLSLFRLAADYVRSFDSVSTVLIGIHSSEHLIENLELVTGPRIAGPMLDKASAVIARWMKTHEPI